MKRSLWALVVLSLGYSQVGLVRADDPPSKLLDDVASRAKVANQAVKASVNDALSKAGKLPADAGLIVLAEAEAQVKEATYLSTEDKKELLEQIAGKRKSLGGTGFAETSSSRPGSAKEDPAVIEHQIRQELNVIRSLRQQGQDTQANAKLKALAEKYPTHPALLANTAVGSRSETIRDQERLTRERGANQQAALNDVSQSASSSSKNIEYNKKVWDKANKREPIGGALSSLSAQEKKILKALDEKSSTDFFLNNTSFEQILKMLEKEVGFPLIVSKATMEDMRIDYTTTLTYSIPKSVTKRTLLRSVLGELGLTYIIKAETLQVVSVLQAKNEMRAGVLDIRAMMATGTNPEDLIRLIKSTVEPDSWDTASGHGTITFHPPGTLIIRNSAEVIYSLGARRR